MQLVMLAAVTVTVGAVATAHGPQVTVVIINVPEFWNVQQLVSVTVQVYVPASAACAGLIVIAAVFALKLFGPVQLYV